MCWAPSSQLENAGRRLVLKTEPRWWQRFAEGDSAVEIELSSAVNEKLDTFQLRDNPSHLSAVRRSPHVAVVLSALTLTVIYHPTRSEVYLGQGWLLQASCSRCPECS